MGDAYKDNIVAVTDPAKGTMRQICDRDGYVSHSNGIWSLLGCKPQRFRVTPISDAPFHGDSSLCRCKWNGPSLPP